MPKPFWDALVMVAILSTCAVLVCFLVCVLPASQPTVCVGWGLGICTGEAYYSQADEACVRWVSEEASPSGFTLECKPPSGPVPDYRIWEYLHEEAISLRDEGL